MSMSDFGYWYSKLTPEARLKFHEMKDFWTSNRAVEKHVIKLKEEFEKTGEHDLIYIMLALTDWLEPRLAKFKEMERTSGFNLNWCSDWPPHVNQMTPGDIFIKENV